jgi:AraC-like DNA-binding protein
LPDRMPNPLRTRERQRYERAVELYLRYCYRNRTVARVSELAQFIEANRPHLSRAVAETFGESLGSILRRKQLQRAARLLTDSALTIDDIAAASGFGHRSSFFRRFRDSFGVTPNQYRRMQPNATGRSV